jgi:hypothetical protein
MPIKDKIMNIVTVHPTLVTLGIGLSVLSIAAIGILPKVIA